MHSIDDGIFHTKISIKIWTFFFALSWTEVSPKLPIWQFALIEKILKILAKLQIFIYLKITPISLLSQSKIRSFKFITWPYSEFSSGSISILNFVSLSKCDSQNISYQIKLHWKTKLKLAVPKFWLINLDIFQHSDYILLI